VTAEEPGFHVLLRHEAAAVPNQDAIDDFISSHYLPSKFLGPNLYQQLSRQKAIDSQDKQFLILVPHGVRSPQGDSARPTCSPWMSWTFLEPG